MKKEKAIELLESLNKCYSIARKNGNDTAKFYNEKTFKDENIHCQTILDGEQLNYLIGLISDKESLGKNNGQH